MTCIPVLVLVAAVVSPVLSASLPSYVKPCKRDDPNLSKCFRDTLQEMVPRMVNGEKSVKLPPLDPFIIEELTLQDLTGSKSSHINLKFKNMKVIGIKSSKISPDTSIDLKNKKKLVVKLNIPHLFIEGSYVMDGNILKLPIKGDGNFNTSLDDLTIKYDADITFKKGPDGKEYVQFVKPKIELEPQNFKIHLENLFNGDKTLGDTTNDFLNENWKESFQEFGPAIKNTCSEIINPLLNSVSNTVPYDEVFPK